MSWQIKSERDEKSTCLFVIVFTNSLLTDRSRRSLKARTEQTRYSAGSSSRFLISMSGRALSAHWFLKRKEPSTGRNKEPPTEDQEAEMSIADTSLCCHLTRLLKQSLFQETKQVARWDLRFVSPQQVQDFTEILLGILLIEGGQDKWKALSSSLNSKSSKLTLDTNFKDWDKEAR